MPGILRITRGLPASGKTTWSRDQIDARPAGSIVRLNRDDLRAMLLPSDYREPQHTAEELVTVVQHGPIGELLGRGVDVIVDDTNLRTRNVKRLAQIAAQAGARWECVDFLDVPLDECLRRDQAREFPVGVDVIRGMHDKFLSGGRKLALPVLDEPVTGKPYVAVPGTPRAIIVDIDGTVADHGTRNPYDTSRYHEDTPKTAVIEQVRMAASAGMLILFTSGRDVTYRDATSRWLCDHVVTDRMVWDLIMRPAGDTRSDAVVKLELFDQHIRDRCDVRWVLDDRDRVVRMWRSLGLTCMQVDYGDF